MSAQYAKLKDYDARREHVIKRYIIDRTLFEAGIWHEVSDPMAVRLQTLKQNESDSESPLAFQVVSADEYNRLINEDESRGKGSADSETQEKNRNKLTERKKEAV
jgi:hypothetical protein